MLYALNIVSQEYVLRFIHYYYHHHHHHHITLLGSQNVSRSAMLYAHVLTIAVNRAHGRLTSKECVSVRSLLKRHSETLDCGWKKRPWYMEGSCECRE